MNRVTQTSLYGLLIFICYFGLAIAFQACGNKKDKDERTVNEQLEGLTDEHSEETFFEEEGANYESTTTYETKEDPGSVDYTAAPQQTSSASTTSSTTNSRVITSTASNSTAPFMVVAGNYLVEGNADEMVRKLSNLGYPAEKVVFDLSQYYTVLAGRYDTRTSAQRTSDALKTKGIDNYVMRKK